MHPCPRRWVRPLQLLHRPQHPSPHRVAVQVADLKHGVRPHGGLDRRVLAVLLYDDAGGAVDVEVGDHLIAGVQFTFVLSYPNFRYSDASCPDHAQEI